MFGSKLGSGTSNSGIAVKTARTGGAASAGKSLKSAGIKAGKTRK
jgi:hypothetical protein